MRDKSKETYLVIRETISLKYSPGARVCECTIKMLEVGHKGEEMGNRDRIFIMEGTKRIWAYAVGRAPISAVGFCSVNSSGSGSICRTKLELDSAAMMANGLTFCTAATFQFLHSHSYWVLSR